ncbi:Male sterility protein [Aspergillus sp. HF37]|nr:Male sterility protein [Aspergillus sp. HF37]
MEHQLCFNARNFPDAVAIFDQGTSITYQQLIAQADALAQDMQHKTICAGDPVGILLGPGAGQVIAQVAVIRAGGTCVPIDPSVPDLLLRDMLADLSVRLVITTDQLAQRVASFSIVPIELASSASSQLDKLHDVPVMAGCPDSHRSHILHTSGSTGKPKPVQILARSIIHLAAASAVSLLPTDRVAEFNNPGFDLSLFEIWVPLLSGAAIVHVPKLVVTDPSAIGGFFKKHNVTAMILPSALFTVLATGASPDAFGAARHVIVAGEPPNTAAMRKVLENQSPPENLWNGYGPMEATCLSTLQRVTLEETYRRSISAGKPIGQTQLFLLDNELCPIHDADLDGEICIGGPGLSDGYFNRPEENAERFIDIRTAQHQEKRHSDASYAQAHVRVYRTGDIGRWREPGQTVDYVGRADTQVKHKGFRIELGAIERVIEEHKHVKAATVLQLKQDDSQSHDRLLVAWVVLDDDHCNGTKSPASPILHEITDWVRDRMPYYMVPNRAWSTSEFPRTAYGKIDRRALAEQAQDQSQRDDRRNRDRAEQPRSRQSVSMRTKSSPMDIPKTFETLLSLLQDVLPTAGRFEPGDNILSLGLSSLDAARFISLVNKHIGPLSLEELYQSVSLASLAHRLSEQRETNNYGPNEILKFESDSQLADDIELAPDWRSEGRVFLTGATGFIGTQILHRLLAMPQLNQVACLARWDHRHGLSPLNRIKQSLKRYDMWDEAASPELIEKKVLIVEGDITQRHLGLADTDYQWLVNWTPAVFHAAAKVNWCEPYSTHFEPNVLGTKNMLRVAVDGRRKTFHYLSSIDVWGVTGFVLGTEAVSEDGPLKVHLASLPFDTGYAQSQWVADEMVRKAQGAGLPATIYRPGFVVGDKSTAAGNPDDFFGRMVIGCIQLGYWPELPSQNMEYVTVDYVCDAMLCIAADNRNLGKAFNLTAPDAGKITNMERLCSLINQAGFCVRQIPYSDWLDRLHAWDGLETSPLLSLMPLLAEPVLRGATRLQTSKFSPVYECRNTQKALINRPDIQYTQLSPRLIKMFVDFWVGKGFYRI